MKKVIKFFIFIVFLIFLLNPVFSAGTVLFEEYEYVIKITPNCEEYRGYLAVELPEEYNLIQNDLKYTPKSYMDAEEYFILPSVNQEYYELLSNWYVKTIDDFQIQDVELIYDGNTNSDLVIQDKDSIVLDFLNPDVKKLNKITVYAKDSQLEDLTVKIDGNIIPIIITKNAFLTEIYLDKDYLSNNVEIELKFDELVKINEIKFYNQNVKEVKSMLYFFNKEQCSNTYNFYFGKYGVDYNKRYASAQYIPVDFEIEIDTNKNTLYNNDFDNDSKLNEDDNCLIVSNEDQKDINFNDIGDACEDFDSDRVLNFEDNCIEISNRNQMDSDDDKIGDACDDDDGRYLESNNGVLYLLLIFVVLLFVGMAYLILKKK
ncbi:MAG: thrombospondin type 3 repeat-containing protein [Candidatus Woesearchaeota archaeon]|jgi:hypothetical protein|nr:thrombospondin type 3 repeat-containing protein [Candidatus Woesearchaeota archaeon]